MIFRNSIAPGFTLIELMITLVVLVVIVMLAAPSFVDTLDRRRVVDATESVVKQVQQARASAIETNRQVSMVFREPDGAWCFGLTDANDCNCFLLDAAAEEACTIPFAAASDLSGIDDERELIRAQDSDFPGVALDGAPAEMRFEPLRGLRVDGGDPTVQIEFSSARGRQTRVVVNLLGRAGSCSPVGPDGVPSVVTMRACP